MWLDVIIASFIRLIQAWTTLQPCLSSYRQHVLHSACSYGLQSAMSQRDVAHPVMHLSMPVQSWQIAARCRALAP